MTPPDKKPAVRFVEHLDDLISPQEYPDDPGGRRIRIRLKATDEGVEILGDAARVQELEALLEAIGAETIEQMLCG